MRKKIAKDLGAKNTITVAILMLLKQHFANMSKLLFRNTLLLMNGGCQSLDIDRLNAKRCTDLTFFRSQNAAKRATEFGKSVENWKNDVAKKESVIILLIELANLVENSVGEPTKDIIMSCPSYDSSVWDDLKAFICGEDASVDPFSHIK